MVSGLVLIFSQLPAVRRIAKKRRSDMLGCQNELR